MRKINFVFYYFFVLVFSIVTLYSFTNWTTLEDNSMVVFSASVNKNSKKKNMKTVSIAMSDRIGNISFYDKEFEYNGDLTEYAKEVMENLFMYSNIGIDKDKKIKGAISSEAKFLNFVYDSENRIGRVYVSNEYIEGRGNRQRTVAKKQILLTLSDIFRDMEDVVFIINGKEYEY